MHKNVSNIILHNSLFLLMREHSMEVGQTLHLLYQINRIGEMRNEFFGVNGNLYETFITNFMLEIQKYQNTIASDQLLDDTKLEPAKISKSTNMNETNGSCKDILTSLTTEDDFLLLAFSLNASKSSPFEQCTEDDGIDDTSIQNEKSKTPNAKDIFEELQKTSTCILPFEEIIIKCLESILRDRISSANAFVMQLYREEFGLLKHLQYIRKVLLLEASDLMHQFYTKVFQQVLL